MRDCRPAAYATFYFLEGHISNLLPSVLLCVSGTVCFKSSSVGLVIKVDLLL